jgi:hypothetical protein
LLCPLPTRRICYKISRAAIPSTPAAPGPADAIIPVAPPPEEVDVAAPALELLTPELSDVLKEVNDELPSVLFVVEDLDSAIDRPDV